MRDRPSDTAHRRVLEATLGRPLTPDEITHHRDEDKTNNTPANLEAQTRAAHTAAHNKTRNLSKLRAALHKNAKKLY